LKAPIAATVAQVNGNAGQYLAGGSVNPTATNGAADGFILLNDLNSLQVVAQVNEADMAKISLGEPVDFTIDAFPNQTFTGKVAVIQPLGAVQQNIVNYNVTSTIDPTATKLLPGMTANVNIVTEQRKDVLVVPSAAISFARAQLQREVAAGTPVAGVTGRQSNAGTTAGANAAVGTPAAGVTASGGARAGNGQARPGQGAAGGSGGQRAGTAGAGGANAVGQVSPVRAPILVMDNGQVATQMVEVGLSDGRNTEVISGLKDGQVVVIGSGNISRTPSSPNTARPGGGGGGGGAFGGRGG
jgi:HlyD family secretion protein